MDTNARKRLWYQVNRDRVNEVRRQRYHELRHTLKKECEICGRKVMSSYMQQHVSRKHCVTCHFEAVVAAPAYVTHTDVTIP